MKSNAVLVCAAMIVCALSLGAPARADVGAVTATTNSIQFASLTLNGTSTETVMFYNPGPTVSGMTSISLCVTAGSGCTTPDFSTDVSGSDIKTYGSYSGGPCNSTLMELDSGTLCWVNIIYTQNTFQPANATLEVTGFIGTFNVALNASPAIGNVSATEMFLQTTTEDEPNAYPEGSAPDGLYGDSSSTSCSYSIDTITDPCWNPLEIDFDASQIYTSTTSPTPAALASLSEPYAPSSNLLADTNSIGSSDGGLASISASFGCNSGNLDGSIVATNEDGSVFTFSVSQSPTQSCSPLPQSLQLTFTSTGGSSDNDSGTAVLYNFANSALSGTYTGTWDNANSSDSPLKQGGTGSSSIDLSIADDFTATATAVIPAQSFGSCQTQDLTFTTSQAVSLGQGITSTVGGYATGGNALLTAADSEGDVLWLIGSTTDGSGKLLSSGELFFSAYVATAGSGLSSCSSSIFWDAPFQKKHAPAKPIHHPTKHLQTRLPRKWQARGAFDRTAYHSGDADDRNGSRGR